MTYPWALASVRAVDDNVGDHSHSVLYFPWQPLPPQDLSHSLEMIVVAPSLSFQTPGDFWGDSLTTLAAEYEHVSISYKQLILPSKHCHDSDPFK